MAYEFASAEHIGDRKEQQDRVIVATHPTHPEVVLAMVADGMGGHVGGALASQAVHDAVTSVFAKLDLGTGTAADWLKAMIMAAHHKVTAAGQGHNRDPRSTVVLALARPERLDWAWCGDSRLYYFREGVYERRSEDHSLVEVLLAQGKITEAEVHTHPERSKLFSSLGGPEPPQIGYDEVTNPEEGDTLMLASDGVWAYFYSKEMEDLIGYRNLPQSCERLIQLARVRAEGNGDNLSIAMIRKPAPQKRGLLSGIFGSKPVEPSPLEDTRRFMKKYLHAVMGPASDDINGRIDGCKTSDQLLQMVDRAAENIRMTGDATRAERFIERARGLMHDEEPT